MLKYEIKKNKFSDQFGKNIIPLIFWPIIELFQVYFNYIFFTGNEISSFFGLNTNYFLTYIFSAYIAYAIFSNYVENAWRIGFEKYQGVISQFFLTPFSRMRWLIIRSISVFFSSSWIYVLIYLIFLGLNTSIDIFIKLNLLIYILLVIICSFVWGSFLTAIFVSVRDGSAVFSLINILQYISSGIQVPISFLPLLIILITKIFPLSLLTISLQTWLINGNAIPIAFFLQIIFVNLILLLITNYLFKSVERKLRISGNFDLH